MTHYSIWLGCNASIWSHRGYRVCGEHVYTEDRADALRIVRESIGEDMVAVRTEDGTYCYRTQEDADADETGASADAVVTREALS
jgi:hypothetical protein